jgi:hypothetical protein
MLSVAGYDFGAVISDVGEWKRRVVCRTAYQLYLDRHLHLIAFLIDKGHIGVCLQDIGVGAIVQVNAVNVLKNIRFLFAA